MARHAQSPSTYSRRPPPARRKAPDEVGGTCVDVWVDRSEHIIRYIEIKTLSGKSVLAPFNLSVIKKNAIFINSIMSSQFEDVPGLKNANTISLLEEEKIMGYYGAGTLMAFPRRRESFF